MVHIDYRNIDEHSYWIRAPSYTYSLHKVPFSEYKVAQRTESRQRPPAPCEVSLPGQAGRPETENEERTKLI